MLLTHPKSESKLEPLTLSWDYDEVFFSVKQMTIRLGVNRAKVIYKINFRHVFAVRMYGQWRVSTETLDFFNDMYASFPVTISFDLLCRFFKIRKQVMFEILYEGVLPHECIDGQIIFAKEQVFDYILAQSNHRGVLNIFERRLH